MLPINFEGAKWIGKPKSMTDEECYGMPAKPGKTPDKEALRETFNAWFSVVEQKELPETADQFRQWLMDAFIEAYNHFKPVIFQGIPAYHFIDERSYPQWLTAWKPNVDDLKALNEGGAIWIKSLGEGLVPMAVFTKDEKGDNNEG